MKIITHDSRFICDFPITVDWKYRIKKIAAPLFDLLYKWILFCNRPKVTAPKKYQLVACAIFKDEGPFIKEWIEHNALVGIEHFYLYNNFSGDNYQEVLKPYIDKGVVTLIDWPVEQGQFLAYEHFWANYRNDSQWVTFIDLDEFYCPLYDLTVREWLKKFKNQPSVIVYWKMFGTSGVIDPADDKLVTEQYTICWDKMDSIGKTIINTDWEFDKIYHHSINAKCRFLGRTVHIASVDEFGHYHRWSNIIRCIPTKKEFTIQLNHYWSKSYQTYFYKRNRGSVCPNYSNTMEQFWWHEHNNRSVDYSIFRFMIDLKLKMKGGNDL